MNLEIHHNGESDYLDSLKEKFKVKILAIKNSKLLTPKSKKVRIKTIKRAFLKEKKETGYNNF
ncbi:hypothetical protein JBL43_12735 [Aureibaculum sp. A20]|uniref:30S ribosomal protein S21 n=1 Tax=Aureibaculum flavum TaxID=2795986 RepID=A0ABS0WSZ7_9FLAO|nr:hypothetical protein [Aureibaculum flavum]MBJ2175111.1 hypothetical protein [Aureibaculum flavum]